jgi:malonate transporter
MSRRIAILARMRAILAVTVPFFALVLLGWLAARAGSCRKAPSPASMPTCSSSPCPACCFVSAPALSLDRLADPALLGIYLVSAMLMIAIAVALTLRRRRRPDHGVGLKDAAFGALVAAFPDAGFMGVPLLVARFGDPAAGPVIGVPSSSICSSRARSVWHWRRPRQRTSPAGPNAAPCTPPGSPCAAPSPTPCRGRSSSARHRRRRTSSWRHRSRRSCACSAIRQHRSPFSRSAPCSIAPAACPFADAARPLLARRAAQALRPPGACLRHRPCGARARRAGASVRPDGADAHGGAAERGQRFDPRRGLGADNGRIARIILASTALAFISFSVIAWVLSRSNVH